MLDENRGSIAKKARDLIRESKEIRKKNEVTSSNPPTEVFTPSSAGPKKRKESVNLGKVLLEFERDSIKTLKESDIKPAPPKKECGRPKKNAEEKAKQLFVYLTQDELIRFNKIKRPANYRYKSFGATRKVVYLMDEIERLSGRERKRVSKLIGILRDFKKIYDEYSRLYKDREEDLISKDFLKKFRAKYNIIIVIFEALSFSREELKDFISEEEFTSLQMALYMSNKESSGELNF